MAAVPGSPAQTRRVPPAPTDDRGLLHRVQNKEQVPLFILDGRLLLEDSNQLASNVKHLVPGQSIVAHITVGQVVNLRFAG